MLCKIRTINIVAAQIYLQLHRMHRAIKTRHKTRIKSNQYSCYPIWIFSCCHPNLNQLPNPTHMVKYYYPQYQTMIIIKNISHGAPTQRNKDTGKRNSTIIGSMEMDIKLLHSIVNHLHLVVAHHPRKIKLKKIK